MNAFYIPPNFWRFFGSFIASMGLFLCCHAQNACDEIPAENCCQPCFHGHRFLLGPEAVHVERSRDMGARQHGWLGGVRFIYEHRRRYCFYWGLEGALSWGTFRGHTSTRGPDHQPREPKPSKSKEKDGIIEARFGYTFQCKNWWRPEFTPFVGGGYVSELNILKPPSTAGFHTKVTYGYITGGFLSSISPTDYLTLGLNVKVRYIIDPKCRITHDSFDSKGGTTFLMGDDQLQYRIELPISYLICNRQWGVTAIPFYEHRYYGGKKFHPRDIAKICYYNYGATLALAYYY